MASSQAAIGWESRGRTSNLEDIVPLRADKQEQRSGEDRSIKGALTMRAQIVTGRCRSGPPIIMRGKIGWLRAT